MSSSDDYTVDRQVVHDYVEKYGKVIARIRATYGGQSIAVVREALLRAFEAEGLSVWAEVLEDAARQIVNNGE